MLNQEDKKYIKDTMIDSFGEFFNKIIEPYFEAEREANLKEHEKIIDKIDTIHEHLTDHEKRIRKLEITTHIS